MAQQHTTVRRFTASDGFTFVWLDGCWRDSLCANLTDLTADGGADGPTGDDGAPLWGTLTVVKPTLRIEWIDGPRQGETLNVPMTAVEGLVDIGGQRATGWTLEPNADVPWVIECLEYGINDGSQLEGRRYLPDTIDQEPGTPEPAPNLSFGIEFLPTDVAPVTIGEKDIKQIEATVAEFLAKPTL